MTVTSCIFCLFLVWYIIFACVNFSLGCGPNITYGGGCNEYNRIFNTIIVENTCKSKTNACLQVQFINKYDELTQIRVTNKVESITNKCNKKTSSDCQHTMESRYPLGSNLTIYEYDEGGGFYQYYSSDYLKYYGKVGFSMMLSLIVVIPCCSYIIYMLCLLCVDM